MSSVTFLAIGPSEICPMMGVAVAFQNYRDYYISIEYQSKLNRFCKFTIVSSYLIFLFKLT